MKKVIYLMIACVLSITMPACGAKQETTADNQSKNTQTEEFETFDFSVAEFQEQMDTSLSQAGATPLSAYEISESDLYVSYTWESGKSYVALERSGKDADVNLITVFHDSDGMGSEEALQHAMLTIGVLQLVDAEDVLSIMEGLHLSDSEQGNYSVEGTNGSYSSVSGNGERVIYIMPAEEAE